MGRQSATVRVWTSLVGLAASLAVSACSDSEPEQPSAGTAGSGGTAAGAAGAGASAVGGNAGSGGTVGGGNAGGGGSGAAGTAGNASGSAGASGNAGASGSAGAGIDGGSSGCGSTVVPGTTTQTLVVDGEQRSYLLVIPASLDARTPAPVLFGFHGGSGTSLEASRYGLTGTDPMFYVYPQANAHPQGGIAWELESNTDDIAFFEALLIELGQKYCIDKSRVFAAGKSNGAFFINLLACDRPGALRAIAPVAGGGPWTNCTQGVAAMVVHGTADTVVTIDRGIGTRDYWRAANGCTSSASAPFDPPPCVAYSGCSRPVVWCEHAGAHDFPAFAGPGIRKFFLSF